jgi:hypothetical protein
VLSLKATPAMQAPVQRDFVGRRGSVPDVFDDISPLLPPSLASLNCDGRFIPCCFPGRTAAPVKAPLHQDFVGQRRLVFVLTLETCDPPN